MFPKQARYQLRYTRISDVQSLYTIFLEYARGFLSPTTLRRC